MVFPLLAVLVVLAPAVIPWIFGGDWTEAVAPTQMLVLGGAATLVINAAGSALMAAGRARALLGFGVAHFIVYAGAVVVVAHLGLVAVAIAGSVVHTALPRRRLRDDAARRRPQPAQGAVRRPLARHRSLRRPDRPGAAGDLLLEGANVPVTVLCAGVGLAAAVGYLGTLRLCFPSSARDLGLALERIVPARILNVGRRGRGEPAPAL